MLHPHDESHAYRFCPRCGGALERRLLKASEPERPVCTRCGFVFYIDPKIAVGTIIRDRERPHRAGAARHRAGLRQVGVSRRLCRPRRAADRRPPIREAREECGLDVRLDGLVNIYSYAGRAPVIVVYAATAIGGELCVDDECLESGGVRRTRHSVGRARVPEHARRPARLPGRRPPPDSCLDRLTANWSVGV